MQYKVDWINETVTYKGKVYDLDDVIYKGLVNIKAQTKRSTYVNIGEYCCKSTRNRTALDILLGLNK